MTVRRLGRYEQRLVLGVVVILAASCVPLRDANVPGPEGASDLAVTASTGTPQMFEGTAVTVSADARGGIPPYLFRWDQNAGPTELTLPVVTESTLTSEPLRQAGTYVFRVVVTDNAGAHTAGFVTVEVLSAVTATVPKLVVVGEPVALSATVETQPTDATLLWEVTFGEASLDDTTSRNPTLTIATASTVRLRLTATIPSASGSPMTTERNFEIASVRDLKPQVLIETNFGDITIELNGEAAPLHTANFLLYVNDGFYAGLLFHRSVCSGGTGAGDCKPFVLQGGGYKRVDGELQAVPATRDPVPSEANNGLSNGVLYSVALALNGGDPDSGTIEFFTNLSTENSFLDDQGFTVFGQVVNGTSVVDEITAIERKPSPIIPGEVSLPADDVIMQRVSRLEH